MAIRVHAENDGATHESGDREARAGLRANAEVPLDRLSRRCFWDIGSAIQQSSG